MNCVHKPQPQPRKHDQRSSSVLFSAHNLQRAEREKATCVNHTSGFLLRAKGDSWIKENPTLNLHSALLK